MFAVAAQRIEKMMAGETIRSTVGLLTLATLFALPGNPGVAADIGFRAYLGIPLSGGGPYFGFCAGLEAGILLSADDDPTKLPRAEFELRYGTEDGPAFLVNGFPIVRPLVLNASDGGKSQGTENPIDWRAIGAAALGIGLIVAVANADEVTVRACSGTNCPPEEKPPPQPKPPDSGGGT